MMSDAIDSKEEILARIKNLRKKIKEKTIYQGAEGEE
jgi:hypothetical protein